MNRAHEEQSKAADLSTDEHFHWRAPIENHEADMKSKGVEGQDEAVHSHLFLLETDEDSQARKYGDGDHEVGRVRQEDQKRIDEIGLADVPLLCYFESEQTFFSFRVVFGDLRRPDFHFLLNLPHDLNFKHFQRGLFFLGRFGRCHKRILPFHIWFILEPQLFVSLHFFCVFVIQFYTQIQHSFSEGGPLFLNRSLILIILFSQSILSPHQIMLSLS